MKGFRCKLLLIVLCICMFCGLYLSYMSYDQVESNDLRVLNKIKEVSAPLRHSKTVMYNVEQRLSELRQLCSSIDGKDLNTTKTSVKYSRINDVEQDESDSNLIYVFISTYNHRNMLKTIGGDVLIVTAKQTKGNGRSSSHVVDFNNGSYTASLRIWWSGSTEISVRVASFIENYCLRDKAVEKFGNQVFTMENGWGIRGLFVTSQGEREYTPCGPTAYMYGYDKLCNFTLINDGMSWYCGKPKRHGIYCEDIYSFGTGAFKTGDAKASEKVLLPTVSYFNDQVSINHTLMETNSKGNISCSERSSSQSWTEIDAYPSGYWLEGQWHFVKCFSSCVPTIKSYRECLKNKTVYFFGDSTIRNYFEFFARSILENDFSKKSLRDGLGKGRTYHSRTTYSNFGITTAYLKHEMPFHNPDFPPNGITSFPSELKKLSNSDIPDDKLIIVVGYHTHFQAYPINVYKQRIHELAKALEQLIKRKPKVKLFYKGPHVCHDDTRWFDNRLSLIYQDIVKETFQHLWDNVTYLDTWSVTATHGNSNLHPSHEIFDSQIQQLMAFVC